MANLLQSSQTQATTAPQYFTDYLSNLASKGTEAATNAQFVGAQPLQEQAFNMAAQNAGQFQAPVQAGQQMATNAANTNISGAAQPYLSAATSASPLNAMQPYAQSAMQTTGAEVGAPMVGQGVGMSGLSAADPYLSGASQSGGLRAAVPYLNQATQSPAELAQQYMNPFINTAVQSMSDIAQRNIRNNLAPAATAAAVGSGQFGSQRGAQVQGQINANAQQDLNSQISQLLASGYGQALTAGGQQNALLGQLGSTAGNLGQQQANLLGQLGSTAGTLTNQQAQNLITGGTNLGNLQQNANQTAATLGGTAATAQGQQNQALLTAAQTAANAAGQQGQLQNTAAQNMGSLGQIGQGMSLADINALATMGGQQQTIGQNEQLFPLNNLSTLSGLMRGYSVPSATKTTAESSPLSVLSGIGAGTAGLFSGSGAAGTGPSVWDNIKKVFGTNFNGNTFGTTNVGDQSGDEDPTGGYWDNNGNWQTGNPPPPDEVT
jgi:hypothetical protein